MMTLSLTLSSVDFSVTLEARIALFLFGVALFVVGGAGYNATERSIAGEAVRK